MTAEVWARDGGDISLEKTHLLGIYLLRVTDLKREVTIQFHVDREDLRSLRKWIKDVQI